MGATTGIEWTDATWNPIRGCSRVSEGCRNCYAESVAHRFSGPGQPCEGLTKIVNGHPTWSGEVRFVENHLLDPLKWRAGVPLYDATTGKACGRDPNRPRRIFVNSMSDLFHENVPDEWIDKIFAVMALCPQHTFQVLTKRPERMLKYLADPAVQDRVAGAISPFDLESVVRLESYADRSHLRGADGVLVSVFSRWPFPNVWLGVSVEDQATADKRIPLLLQTPAAVRFVSAEPLLGPLELDDIVVKDGPGEWHFSCLDDDGSIEDDTDFHGAMVDWIICGGESGPGARPMHPGWALGLRDQCVTAGVPFFFKQWGEWSPVERRDDLPARPWMVRDGDALLLADGSTVDYDECGGVSDALPMRRVGKKSAGAMLDGREWREFPGVRS